MAATCPTILNKMLCSGGFYLTAEQKHRQPTLFQRVYIPPVSNIIIYKLLYYSWSHTVRQIKLTF